MQIASACPFCNSAGISLSELVDKSDAVALVEWVAATPGDGDMLDDGVQPGRTTFRVKRVLKGASPQIVGEVLTAAHFHAGKRGNLILLCGNKTDKGVDWTHSEDVTEAGFRYAMDAPSPKEPAARRLLYYSRFLEHPESSIANDAFTEWANAPYSDLEPVARQLSREKVRHWITNPKTPETRLGMYGMLLGLCGNDSDAALLEQKILSLPQSDDEAFRLGIDGFMGGYLLLRGQQGLDILDENFLRNHKLPFSEVYATAQALRFIWSYGANRIPPERIRKSMRILLDRAEMRDLVIADLARWKDWSLHERLMLYYSDSSSRSSRLAIVRYFLACVEDRGDSAHDPVPPHVTKALECLAKLRRQDPAAVNDAERYFAGKGMRDAI